MTTTMYALFPTPHEARAGLTRLLRAGHDDEGVSVVVHHDALSPSELRNDETGLYRGFAQGIVVGSVVGALLGFLVAGPLGLLHVSALAGTCFGGCAGGTYGGMAGLLGGAAGPSPRLARLSHSRQDGDVLVTVSVAGLERVDEVENIMAGHGAEIERRPFL